LTNGQVYVHEILKYPNIHSTFILWPDEDFACVKNIRVESISNDKCLIFFTKMSFVIVMLYSLSEKQILSTKKEMIPKTAIIAGNIIFCYYVNGGNFELYDSCFIDNMLSQHQFIETSSELKID